MDVLRIFVSIITILMTMPSLTFAMEPNDIVYMTEQYPPYNFEESGKVKGIVADLVMEMMAKMGVDKPIKLVPWARGYQKVQTDRGTCLFSMTFTKEREPLFKWVGPVATTRVTLVKLKKNQMIKINDLDDVNKYKVGVIRSDIGEQLLINSGKVNTAVIEPVDRTVLNIRKLAAGRIDLISYGDAPLKWEIKKNGFNIADFETVFKISEGRLFIAFHKETPDKIIETFQQTLDGLKADGTYDRIISNYLK
jgi:polar amino acid transport system substrate-binding protein